MYHQKKDFISVTYEPKDADYLRQTKRNTSRRLDVRKVRRKGIRMSQKTIYIHAGWENDAPIGILYIDIVNGEEVVSFQYFEKWLRDHPSLLLDPMIANIPYRNYPTDKLLFGAFEDTCPDRWGEAIN